MKECRVPTDQTGETESHARLHDREGKFRIQEGEYLMKTKMKSSVTVEHYCCRSFAQGVVATFLGGNVQRGLT